MKKLLTTVAVAGITACAFGQGSVILNNFPGTAGNSVIVGATGQDAATTANLLAALYWNDAGVNFAGGGTFVQVGSTLPINIVPGRYIGSTASTFGAGNLGGTTHQFQVRVFQSTLGATWEAALTAAGGLTPAEQALTLFGSSTLFTSLVGGPDGLPTPDPTATDLANIVTRVSLSPVPEPSVIALGVLGALALLFRRRK